MKILSVGAVARRIGVHPYTLLLWDRSGKLPAMRDSANRKLYTEEQIEEFLAQRNTTSAVDTAHHCDCNTCEKGGECARKR